MSNKKKTTAIRAADYAKAGDKRRKPYTPVRRVVKFRHKDGSTGEKRVECEENMRHGPGSNRPFHYSGSPLVDLV